MKITIQNNTIDKCCNCESWLEHWKKYSKSQTTYCREKDCLNIDLVGAHIQKVGSEDKTIYIVPLCHAHKRFNGEIELSQNTALALANTLNTCGEIL